METFDDIMLAQVKALIQAGVRDGETIEIFEIFLDHTFVKCPNDITLDNWEKLHEELGRAFPHIDSGTVVDTMMERGYYLAQVEEQPDYIVSWWRSHMRRHRMIIENPNV